MSEPTTRSTTADGGPGTEHLVEHGHGADRRSGERRRARPGDRLTGLAEREAFARAVDQADRDRDRLLVAVIAIDGLAEINQLCGYDVGDSLLAALGRTVAERASVDVTTGRIGGSQLGLLQTPARPGRPTDLLDPVLDDLDRAIDHWLQERVALGTPCPIAPRALAGVAAGYGGSTWADAEVALAVARTDPDGPSLVTFDLTDDRLARRRRRQVLADDLADALATNRLIVDRLLVTPVDRPVPLTDGSADADGARQHDTSWLRLLPRPAMARPRPIDAANASRVGVPALGPDDLALAPGLAGRLDRHLIERATEGLTPERATAQAPGPTVTSLPLLGPLIGPRSALDHLVDPRAPVGPALANDTLAEFSARLVVEVHQVALTAVDPDAIARRLEALGWRLAITGFDGGWSAWDLVGRLPIHHLRPRPELLAEAEAGRPGSRDLLLGITSLAAEREIAVVAALDDPPDGTAIGRYGALGVTHLDRLPA